MCHRECILSYICNVVCDAVCVAVRVAVRVARGKPRFVMNILLYTRIDMNK